MYNHRRMTLWIDRALRADVSSCIAFSGAGGKTTAMFELARSLPGPVLVTATSHLGTWQVGLADRHIMSDSPAPLEELVHGLQGVVLVTGELDGDRTKPANDHLLGWLHQFCGYHAIPLLIEADGSRQKPLKAWADHEPAIPSFVEEVVQVAGLSALGKSLSADTVHRTEIFSQLSGLGIGDKVTENALLQVLTDPGGGLKNIPKQARRVVFLNQADTLALQSTANGMVKALLAAYDSVITASLLNKQIYAVHEPTAAIILAAGEAARYGKIKQLLDWRGEPFVRAVAKTALAADCSPVIVVTGAYTEQVQAAVKDLNVLVVNNPDWKEGQASSIRAGLGSSPSLAQIRRGVNSIEGENYSVGFGGGARRRSSSGEWAEGVEWVGSAIFLLADQPQVTSSVLRALMEKHAEGLYPVVAPMVIDRRANPVLFDRSAFADLASLQGDVGGRAVFHKHRVEFLPWHDDRLLLDVDTPEMYQRLISDESL
jgi:molybdenum cofactor cytidylyltransferase